MKKKIERYKTSNGEIPYRDWFESLDFSTQGRIAAYIDRVAMGGTKKNIKALKDGVFEIKINFGPGYRVYFAEIESIIILLLIGGDKHNQFKDIQSMKGINFLNCRNFFASQFIKHYYLIRFRNIIKSMTYINKNE